MPSQYSVYGLRIDASSPVPGLPPAEHDTPDLVIDILHDDAVRPEPVGTPWYTSHWSDEESGKPGIVIYRDDEGWLTVRYWIGIEFLVAPDATRITAHIPPAASLVDMANYFAGPVLGLVLRMRGVVALHASAIDVGDHAILLTGDASTGKSTTAAVLARMGCRILSEDVAPLTIRDGVVTVSSGCPEIALRSDAVAHLYGSTDALPLFSENWGKHRLDVGDRFRAGSLPVSAVYLLTNRPSPEQRPCVLPMSTTDAMMELLANIYGNRLLHSELRLKELDTVHHLARTVPVKVAMTGGTPSAVEQFCEAVLEDIRRA